jgi:butyryl-CoA dehydrogenase
VAAITGAGSGIGRALAEELARRGCHLALSDLDTAGLAETADLVAAVGGVDGAPAAAVKVTTQRLDVADRQAVCAWADQVVADHGQVNLIFNNAGVGLGATIESMSFEDLDWLLGINLGGVINGTKAFLPHLVASGEGHVVNLSSVFGLISIPTQSAYNAAKFAVRGFTDALRIELEIERRPVSCTTVHPGGIRTNIVRNARLDPSTAPLTGDEDPAHGFDRLARTTPDSAARQILRAVERNRRRVLVGPDAKAIDLVSRLPAGLYQRTLILGGRSAHHRNRRRARQ